MGKVIYLPFEDIPQRYTEMWNQSFIEKMRPDDIIVNPESTYERIENGQFLDTYGTVDYKSKQISMVSKLFRQGLINNGDVFFVPDIFYPGLESIRYMSELSNLGIKIAAFNHAGRADKDDFVQRLGQWSDYQEQAWHDIADIVLVGSNHHKDRVQMKFRPKRIEVVGAIWNKDWMDSKTEYINQSKKDFVIWPHRICQEKGFELFLRIVERNPEMNFVITSCGPNRWPKDLKEPKNLRYLYDLSKREYFSVFSSARYYLSTAYQETFGYTIQEAIYFGCEVICPEYACYPEFVRKECRYSHKVMETPGLLTELFKIKRKSLIMSYEEIFPNNSEVIYNLCKSISK